MQKENSLFCLVLGLVPNKSLNRIFASYDLCNLLGYGTNRACWECISLRLKGGVIIVVSLNLQYCTTPPQRNVSWLLLSPSPLSPPQTHNKSESVSEIFFPFPFPF